MLEDYFSLWLMLLIFVYLMGIRAFNYWLALRGVMTMKKKPKDLMALRLNWLRRRHEKALEEHSFANGYRAGLECAIRAIATGRDILGDSIDEGKAIIR